MSALVGAEPGTPSFFPAVLAQIRGATPHIPLDPVILQALLLCILAGDKNLILRTREEDVGPVAKLAASTLTSVFGYQVHKLKIRPESKHHSPSEFLRTLFLPPSISTPSSWSPTDDLSTSTQKPKPAYKRRLESRTPSTAKIQLPNQSMHRSFSYPQESPIAALTASASTSDSKSTFFFDSTARAEPLTASAQIQRPTLRSTGVNTDPAPSLSHQPSLDTLILPHAVVISGLENASIPAQRALLKVLSERRVVLDDVEGDWIWNLPEGFSVVYVCTADPRDRPAMHKGLLDRFAMSTTINLHPSTLHAVRHNLSYHRPISASTSLPFVPQDSAPSSPILPDTLLESLRALASPSPPFGVPHRTNIHPTLSLYISDLFSATRHHPQLDAMLLTARARQDAEALARAARVIGGDPTGIEFIRAMGKGAEARARGKIPFAGTDAHADDQSLSEDIEWERVDGHGSMYGSHVSSDRGGMVAEEQTLDVSEADIARIVPRVLSHRLRVRDGPEYEILGSLKHGAVETCADWERSLENSVGDAKAGVERDTVKNILVKILSEV